MRIALLLAVAIAAGCGGDTREPGEPLSIDDALAADDGERVTVRGALLAMGTRVRLCSALAESYPPQCGRPWLDVEGLDLDTVEGLQHAGGVSWREGVSLTGTMRDGVLRVT